MTDSAETASTEAAVPQPVAASAGGSWSPDSQSGAASVVDEHPELLVGAAFVGGLLLASILKRLAD
ncbi:MAG: hypothetical protein JO244_07420 [Solirubrobacterales bacterium]|nr:hypothetical protein [Solirubrobacterales bacterium]